MKTPSERGAAFKRYLMPHLNRLRMTQEQFAAEIGLSKAAPTSWFSKGTISKETLHKIAALISRPLDEIMAALRGDLTGDRSELLAFGRVTVNGEEDEDQVFVGRVKGARFAAGSGELVFEAEEVDRSHGFRRDYMQRRGLNPMRCKLFSVKGESMLPTLTDGALVLVNMADREVISGNIYALVLEDGLRVKRLFKRPDGVIEMRSDNPMQHIYPSEPIYDGSAAVIGRVVWHAGDL